MAGKYVTILRPSYSEIGSYTADYPYIAGSGESADLNPFMGSSTRPLVEGEWLQLSATSGGAPRFTRGGNNAVVTPGTPDSEGTVPAFMYFMEEGRIDSQVAGMAHCVRGPLGFEFRTKLCNTTGLSVNDKVSVWDYDGPAGSYNLVRRALAAWSSGWVVGRVSRIYGTNDMSVIYGIQ